MMSSKAMKLPKGDKKKKKPYPTLKDAADAAKKRNKMNEDAANGKFSKNTRTKDSAAEKKYAKKKGKTKKA